MQVRVDGTVERPRRDQAAGTGVATQTRPTFFRTVKSIFSGHLGVGHESAAHSYKVRPAVANNFFRHVKVDNGTDG